MKLQQRQEGVLLGRSPVTRGRGLKQRYREAALTAYALPSVLSVMFDRPAEALPASLGFRRAHRLMQQGNPGDDEQQR